MEILESAPPVLLLTVGLLGLIWVVLLFLVPFMIEGIRSSSRKTHEELRELNRKLDRLTTLMSERASTGSTSTRPPPGEQRAPSPARGPAAKSGARRDAASGRREPTISDQLPRAERPEPRISSESAVKAAIRENRNRS